MYFERPVQEPFVSGWKGMELFSRSAIQTSAWQVLIGRHDTNPCGWIYPNITFLLCSLLRAFSKPSSSSCRGAYFHPIRKRQRCHDHFFCHISGNPWRLYVTRCRSILGDTLSLEVSMHQLKEWMGMKAIQFSRGTRGRQIGQIWNVDDVGRCQMCRLEQGNSYTCLSRDRRSWSRMNKSR